MLLSAVLTLTPLDDAPTPNARQVQRWFKDRIEADDKSLFDALHQPNTARAYTLSEVFAPRGNFPAWLRVTSLDADLSALLVDRLLPDVRAQGEIMLDARQETARFAVRDALLGDGGTLPFKARPVDFHDPGNWAGRTSYGELVTAVMRQPEDPAPRLRLYFHTCTSFRRNAPEGFQSNLSLPMPRYVFQSHLRQWEALSPAKLPVLIAPFLEHYVWVSYHKIRSVSATFAGGSQGKVMGFAGRVDFRLATRGKLPREMRRDWRHYVDVLRLLSAFAFYAGTGSQTSRGLGQTLPLV